jgi:hypothetical protein
MTTSAKAVCLVFFMQKNASVLVLRLVLNQDPKGRQFLSILEKVENEDRNVKFEMIA